MGLANCLASLSAWSVSASTSGASVAWSPRADKKRAAKIMLRAGKFLGHFTFIAMVSWRNGRDATLTFSTGRQLRNLDGGVYWTLVQCVRSRNKGKGGEIAKWSK